MGKAIPVLAAFLIVSAAPALSAPVAGQQTTIAGIPGRLVLPEGTELDPARTYKIELRDGTHRVSATFYPAPQEANPPQQKPGAVETPKPRPAPPPSRAHSAPPPMAQPGPSSAGLWQWIALAAVAAALLSAAALWFYFQRLAPKKRLEEETEPYWRAMEALAAGRYEDALRDLTFVEAKLPAEQRADARFYIALCHFQLGEESDAERDLATLFREQPNDDNVAYFLAYIRIKRGRDSEADPVLESMRSRGRLDFRDASWLLSIVKFRRGMAAYHAGQIEAAAEFFAEVAKLEHLAAKIPSDLRNQHIVQGTRALFEQNVAAAREHFEVILKMAGQAEGEADVLLKAKAKLGLTLAMWIEGDPKKLAALEDALVETCLLLHAEGPVELPWPPAEPGSAKGSADALKKALEDADKNFNLPPEQQHLLVCLRDLHLLRSIAVLRGWSRMEGAAAHKAIADKLKEVLSRLACARAIDERFSDVYLISGLLMFYLHQPGPERTTGVDLLLEARKLGMRDPDALEIVNNRERIERENAGAVDKYEQVLDRYLRDETVRKEVRLDLLGRLSTHRSLMNRYRPPDLSSARTQPPTIQELHDRSEALHVRIGQIGRSSRNQKLEQLGLELKHHSDELSREAAAIEQAEANLLALTGEELFKDR